MSKTLSLILASAALAGVAAVPAWSAMHPSSPVLQVRPLDALFSGTDASRLTVLVDDDEDEDGNTARASSGDDASEDCEEEDGGCGGAAASQPAPAGSVPPPQNGLFGTGAPQVQVK